MKKDGNRSALLKHVQSMAECVSNEDGPRLAGLLRVPAAFINYKTYRCEFERSIIM